MEKVLIVDNDLDSLDTLERVLRKEFQIFRAGNGFEAIHVLDREGEMALVISELSMPVVDGVEFLMGIMHAYPDTVRVVLTRSLDPDLLLAAVNDLKLFRYMVKPFNREELLLVVRQGVGLYRLGKGQKMNLPPVGVLQFPQPQPEYLTIEIDQDQCQAQVEALISSPFFQALSEETDATPPPQSRSEYFTFLDDYSTPEIAFDFFDETKPQNLEEDKDNTVFLIKEFVSQVEESNTLIQEVAPKTDGYSTPEIAFDFFDETKPQNLEEDQDDTVFLIKEFVSQANTVIQTPETKIKEFVQPTEEVEIPPPPVSQNHPKEKKRTEKVAEEHIIEEIDTLIQKLEEQENSKSRKNSDNPLDSPEFRELQRQSNALIARIIRSWG